ncbi:MAG TPA: hypothetical protein VF824_02680 [Thermoanaerobaculia bacterium]
MKTFNSFDLCPSCAGNDGAFFVATWAGPLLTYGLMWYGAYRVRRGTEAQRQLGFALIFANFPVNRMLFVLMGWNDEQYVTRTLFGTTPLGWIITVLLVYAFTVPPLVVAYRAIANRRRALWFAAFFTLPFVYVILFAGFVLEEWLLLRQKVLAQRVIGVPLLIVAVEIISLAIYLTFRNAIEQPRPAATVARP